MIRSLALLVVFALSCSTAAPRLVNDVVRIPGNRGGTIALVDIDDPAGPTSAHLDGLPLSAVVDRLGLSLMARVVVGRDIRTEYMLAPDQVSQLMAAWMTALHHVSGDGFEGFRIVGGNDQLATGLAAPLLRAICRMAAMVPALWVANCG